MGKRAVVGGTATTDLSLTYDESGVAQVTFDAPDKKVNTFSEGVLRQLDAVLDEIRANATTKAVTFRSAKPRNFIAGADISAIAALETAEDANAASAYGQGIFDKIADLPVPSAAFINGSCVGGGYEMALACDYRFASDDPKTIIGLPETQLGILPGWGGTWRLPRIVGLAAATRLILAGETVSAQRALRLGMVDDVFPAAFFVEWSEAAVARILADGHDSRVRANRKRARARANSILQRTGPGRRVFFSAATKNLDARTQGHYPAPTSALGVLRRTARGSASNRSARARALRIERSAFADLAVTSECRNLVRIYFARESNKNHPILEHLDPNRPIAHAAVLGAGVMGGRIAWLFSRNDIATTMKDIELEAVQRGYDSAKESYDALVSRKRLSAREAQLKLNLIHGTTSYGSIGSPDIVIEAIVEKLQLKQAVLAELEPHVSDNTIIASNTSALSIDTMASALKNPKRFVGMHFFNPVNRMPLVEVVRGTKTAQSVVADTVALALRLGKTPVVVKDSPGFLVNRLLMPYLNEAAIMAGEGVD